MLNTRYGKDTRLCERLLSIAFAVSVQGVGQLTFALNATSQGHHIINGERKGDDSGHKYHDAPHTDGTAGQAVELPLLVAAVKSRIFVVRSPKCVLLGGCPPRRLELGLVPTVKRL
jgi:hypothetical protein